MQKKNITVQHNKKRMNIANFINIYIYIYIYTNIYTYIDSINSILQHGRVVDNNFCVVFPT